METTPFTDLVSSMGLPSAILLTLAIALYKAAKWVAPKIETLFEAHVDLVGDLRVQSAQASESNAEILRVSTETLSLIKETRLNRGN
jgi:hypothetical protein